MERQRAILAGLEALTQPARSRDFFIPIRRDALAALVDAAQGHPTDEEVESMWHQEEARRRGLPDLEGLAV